MTVTGCLRGLIASDSPGGHLVSLARLLLLTPVIVLMGCTGTVEFRCENDTPEQKGPKTLFEWAEAKKNGKKKDKDNGKDEKEDQDEQKGEAPGKKNSNKQGEAGKGTGKKEAAEDTQAEKKNGKGGNGKEDNERDKEEDKGPKPLEADRPDFTEASSTVGKGRIQLESGYSFIRDRNDGATTRTHSAPEALLRIGLFADWFEFRLGQNFTDARTGAVQGASSTLITGPSAGIAPEVRANASGAEDLYLGIKLGLTEQKKYLPESALVLQTTVPTGSRDLTVGQLLPGVNYLFGWDVIEDLVSAGGSFQANRSRDDSGHFYVEVAQSLTAGYRLTRRLGAYVEWFAFYPAGAIDPGVGPEHYLDGGFTFLVSDDFQLDARAGLGLNNHADDFFTGVGFAVRY
jgi:hypothetical protein